MTIYLPCLDDYKETFPDVESALTEPDGLLAFRRRFSVQRELSTRIEMEYFLGFQSKILFCGGALPLEQ